MNFITSQLQKHPYLYPYNTKLNIVFDIIDNDSYNKSSYLY